MKSQLNNDMRAIGFLLAGTKASEFADIERTLLDALSEAEQDARLLSLVFSWVKVHGHYVITEKLAKFAKNEDAATNMRLCALAAYAGSIGIHKWKRLAKRQKNNLQLFDGKAYASALKLKGAIDYLAEINIRAAQGSIRIRESDILTPQELASSNQQYRNRYLYGSCWRADIITAIEGGAQTPTEISKSIGCLYEPAHRIYHEYELVIGAGK
jgi:hypothetical protein